MAFWYTVATVLTFATVFRVGRYLLEQHILHSLDLQNVAQFEQIVKGVNPSAIATDTIALQEKVRASVESSPLRFYIEVHRPGGAVIFRSRSLAGHGIPETEAKGEITADFFNLFFHYRIPPVRNPATLRCYNTFIEEHGECRVGEYAFGPDHLYIATSKGLVRESIRGYEEAFLVLLVLLVGASAAIGYGISRYGLKPVRTIAQTARRINSDNLGERIPVPPVRDEISELGLLLNQMFDRLESSFGQIRRFSAEASHELKTPLLLVRLQAERLLLDGNLTPRQEESLAIIADEIGRLNKTIEQLLFLSRAEAQAITLERTAVVAGDYIEALGQDAQALADREGIRVLCAHHGDGKVSIDARWIRHVVLNLLANALHHSPRGSVLELRSELSGGQWRVTVQDEGPGVPAAELERIFERFVRLGKPGANDTGSGLGLAICRSIVGLHGGQIHAELPESGRGLRVVFTLPTQP